MADMIYEINWVDMYGDSRMKVLFIMARTQTPLAIDAKPFYPLNYVSFQSVSGISFIYLNESTIFFSFRF